MVGFELCYVEIRAFACIHTMPDRSCAGTKTILDMVSVDA